MTDHREVELRRFIEAATNASEPIALEDIVGRATDRVLVSDDPATITTLTIELVPEEQMAKKPPRRILAAAAAAVVAVMFIGVVWATRDDSADPVATSSSTDQPAPTSPEPEIPSRADADVARAYWEAIAVSDLDAALAVVDPQAISSGAANLPGPASTLAGLFDFYDAVGWEWEVGECTDLGEGAVDCDVVARTAWSEALGIAPLAITARLNMSDAGVTRLGNPDDDCCPGLGAFEGWVSEMHPDDAAVMWSGRDVESDPEILRLFEVNTARFVAALQTGIPLAAIDAEPLRPLASLSPGDIVVPTDPATWKLSSGTITVNGDRHALVVSDDSGVSDRTVEIWVGPCDEQASGCTIVDNGLGAIPVPTTVERTINGIEWGYISQDYMVAALIGGHLVVVEGRWLQLDIPLLDDPEVVAFLEGLRVASPDDLAGVVPIENRS